MGINGADLYYEFYLLSVKIKKGTSPLQVLLKIFGNSVYVNVVIASGVVEAQSKRGRFETLNTTRVTHDTTF